jgi:deoxyadenosine/deoxycytidine kinase
MQMHLLHQRFKSTRYAQAAALAGKGWYVLDRSYYGDIAFARVQCELGYFRPAEVESYMDAHRNMREFLEPPTVAIFLDAPPEICAQRIAKRARECESGVPLSYLQALDREIRSLKDTLCRRCHVIELDWTVERNETELWERALQLAQELCEAPRDDWDF